MTRVMVIDDRDTVAELIVRRLNECPAVEYCQRAPHHEDGFGGHLSGGYFGFIREQRIDVVVYSPCVGRHRIDLKAAESVFLQCARAGIGKFVLLSSAMVYGASPHNRGLVNETRQLLNGVPSQIATDWHKLESLAISYFGSESRTAAQLTVLRLAAVLAADGQDYFSELFKGRFAVVLPGHDPTIQLLSQEDVAAALRCVFEEGRSGLYNVAPDGTISLRVALRIAGVKRLPISRLVQRAIRPALQRVGLARSIEQLDFVRYSWTISDQKIRNELAFGPRRSSADALAEFRAFDNHKSRPQKEEARQTRFDDFGLDKQYVARFGRTLFTFLHDYYWRVEVTGLDYVPKRGRAVLVGLHRGFMPWDGVMALHLLVQKLRRYPRFLIHPGLIKFPFLFNFMTKLGGIIACQENAAYVLEHDVMLGLFPEGIRGAFVSYREAYKLGKFGRDEYIKIAIRHRAPIIPFVTVGSGDIFPILKKVNWSWWKRHTWWPCFPLTPTWPLLPVPLPSKWHTQFLEPIHLENQYPPEAADDLKIVGAVSKQVRSKMQDALDEILSRRKSIFYGSVFEERNRGKKELASCDLRT